MILLTVLVLSLQLCRTTPSNDLEMLLDQYKRDSTERVVNKHYTEDSVPDILKRSPEGQTISHHYTGEAARAGYGQSRYDKYFRYYPGINLDETRKYYARLQLRNIILSLCIAYLILGIIVLVRHIIIKRKKAKEEGPLW